jgi:hypothetical protein
VEAEAEATEVLTFWRLHRWIPEVFHGHKFCRLGNNNNATSKACLSISSFHRSFVITQTQIIPKLMDDNRSTHDAVDEFQD